MDEGSERERHSPIRSLRHLPSPKWEVSVSWGQALSVRILFSLKESSKMPEDDDPSKSQSSTSKPKPSAKPRAVARKSKAEREEYARKEAERAAERARLGAAATPKTPAVRGGRGGARGGKATVNKTDRTSSSIAAGVFGSGSAARLERSRGAVDLGVSEALDGGETQGRQILQDAGTATAAGPVTDVEETATSRTGTAGRGRGAKGTAQEELIHIEEDDREDQPRRDIERIWISSDEEEDEVVNRKGKQRRTSRTPKPFAGLRPVRAARTTVEEHEDSKEKKPIKANTTTEDNVIIDVGSSDDMQVDDAPLPDTSATAGAVSVKQRAPSSPELTKKTLKKPSDSKTKPDPRVLTETVEERAERLRLSEDIENLREAFLYKSDTDDTIDSKEEEAVFGSTDHDRDRMFLFQLPPLVPQLYDPVTRQGEAGTATDVDGVQVKAEDASSATTAGGDTARKTEDQNRTTAEALPTMFTADAPADQRLPAGLVGKLKIHKSGKVTLDWGGTDMEVRYGTDVDFLQDVVCVENPEQREADEGGAVLPKEGKAYAMGQVKRKMVLVPDWGRIYA